MRLHAEGAKPQGKNLSMAGKFTVCQLAGDTCGKIANCYVGRVCRGVVVEGGGEGFLDTGPMTAMTSKRMRVWG